MRLQLTTAAQPTHPWQSCVGCCWPTLAACAQLHPGWPVPALARSSCRAACPRPSTRPPWASHLPPSGARHAGAQWLTRRLAWWQTPRGHSPATSAVKTVNVCSFGFTGCDMSVWMSTRIKHLLTFSVQGQGPCLRAAVRSLVRHTLLLRAPAHALNRLISSTAPCWLNSACTSAALALGGTLAKNSCT